jgi:diguanylate cyclase (GGDEF)-like protein
MGREDWGPQPGTEPGPAPDIGAALVGRAGEVSRRVLDRWRGSRATLPEHQVTAEGDIERSTQAAVVALASYLVTGQIVGRDRTEQWDRSGEAPLMRHVPLSDVTQVHLYFRQVCVEVLREVAVAIDAAPAALDAALTAVQVGSDRSLVRMARRFEATRHQLETQIAEKQAGLEHLALHDPLTGLANRLLLLDLLDHALAAMARRPSAPVVLFLDLDHFKSVNDASGHSAGDQLLVEVATRLRGLVRPGDTIARLGGDEFVVLCEELSDPVIEGVAVARRITERLASPFRVAGREVFVATSIGVAVAGDGDGAETVLRRADQAMYRAKQLGRGRIELYDPAIDRQATRQAELAGELHVAMADGHLQIAYQPIFDLASGRMVAREALLRWSHPRLGDVAPEEFVPIAEQTGLIATIGSWVLHEACRACAAWRASGSPDVGVTVNVSGRQLQGDRFDRDVRDALAASGLPSDALVIEVTETLLMAGRSEARATFRRLRATGIRIAIDDFGTGYSSLSWLARLPLDIVKVDRSFVATLGLSDRETAIVEAMINLAHTLGLGVVAEGVETELQLEHLVRLGCDQGQGYLLGRPAAVHAAVPDPHAEAGPVAETVPGGTDRFGPTALGR